jgi:hypothetical protein
LPTNFLKEVLKLERLLNPESIEMEARVSEFDLGSFIISRDWFILCLFIYSLKLYPSLLLIVKEIFCGLTFKVLESIPKEILGLRKSFSSFITFSIRLKRYSTSLSSVPAVLYFKPEIL